MRREIITNTIEEIYNLSNKGFLVYKMLYENEWTKINNDKYTVEFIKDNETHLASICKDEYGYWYYEIEMEYLEKKYLRSFLLKDCTFISKDSNQFEEIFKKTKEILLLYLKNNDLPTNNNTPKDVYKIRINDFSQRFLKYFERYGITKEMLYSYNIYEIDYFENSYWYKGKNRINEAKSRRSKLLIGFRFYWGWKIINNQNDYKQYLNFFYKSEYTFGKLDEIQKELLILTNSEINVLTLKNLGYNVIMIEKYKNNIMTEWTYNEIRTTYTYQLVIFDLKEDSQEKILPLKRLNYKVLKWQELITKSKKDKVFTIADYFRYNGSKNKLDKLIKSHLK